MAAFESQADPSMLTMQQISQQLKGQREIFEARLNGMDKAIEIAGRFPTAIDSAMASASVLVNEKFKTVEERFGTYNEKIASIGNQFLQRDVAVSAALQAAEKQVVNTNIASAAASTKSEGATQESLRQLRDLFQTTVGGLTVQINDLKSRVDKSEGHSGGVGDGWGWIVGAVGLLASIIVIVFTVMKRTPL